MTSTPVPTNGSPLRFHRLHDVRHPLGCGERIPCPVHGTLGPYLPAERLRNGTVIAHCCGGSWRPDELRSVA